MTGIEYKQLAKSSADSARRALFDAYYKYVYTVVRGRLQDAPREDVEEVVSDVFAQVFNMFDNGEISDGELKGLLATVSKRRAVDRFRSLVKRPLGDSIDAEGYDSISADESVEEELERRQEQEILIQRIEQLDHPDCDIIIQKYFYDRTSKQIADSLGMKPSAVRMRCARALKKLRDMLTNEIQ